MPRPLRVSPNGRFLVEEDGSPFFWLADTAWTLVMRLDRDETEEYLVDRAEKGFTLVQVVLTGGPADALDVPSRQGDVALLDGDPARPNPAYFEHVDWVIERAAASGIRLGLLPMWSGSCVGGYLDDGAQRVFAPGNAEAYGRFLGERYRDAGVVWILGGDTNPIGPARFERSGLDAPTVLVLADYRPVYDALAGGIRAGAGDGALITYHPTGGAWRGTPEPRTSLYFGDRDWLSVNMIQSCHYRDPQVLNELAGYGMTWYGPENHRHIRAEYDSSPTRPVIDGEPRYEDLAIDVETTPEIIAEKGYWAAYDVRHAAWQAVLAGAAGHTYGHHSVWQMYDPARGNGVQAVRPDLSWRDALHAEGASQMRFVKELFLARPYLDRIPDQGVVVGDPGEGEDHVGATRDRTGRFAVLYLPKGRPVRVELNRISGSRAVAHWLDPRTGTASRVGEFPTTGRARFDPPTSGEREDWVLVLDSADEGFPPPGSAN